MAAEPWADLVSPRVGLIKQLRPQHRAVEEPEPPHLWTARLSNFDFRVAEASERMAAGKGWTEAEAKAAAVGEAVERYCANHVDPRRTFVARASELTLPAITPDPLPRDAVRAARLAAPAAGIRTRRSRGSRASGCRAGSRSRCPAAFVYLSVPRPEESFAPVTSNGLAAGSVLAGRGARRPVRADGARRADDRLAEPAAGRRARARGEREPAGGAGPPLRGAGRGRARVRAAQRPARHGRAGAEQRGRARTGRRRSSGWAATRRPRSR